MTAGISEREQVARLIRLEHRQRILQPLAGLSLVATVAALLAFTTRPPDVIEARRVDLVNQQGVRQASLVADTTGVLLTLLDGNGRATASFRFNDDPWLAVLTQAGREVAGLGAPRTQHLAE